MSDYERSDGWEAEELPPIPADREELTQAPSQEADFEPDFGNAFDDYGDYYEEPAPARPRAVKRRRHLKRMRFPRLIKVAIYLVIVVLLGVLAANIGWKCADDVLALTRPDENVEIVINEMDDLDDIAATLKDSGAINYEWLFKFFCRFFDFEDRFDPGIYTINKTYDYHALINSLNSDAQSRETVKLMIIEGANCYEIFDLLEKNGVCTREKLEQTAANYHFTSTFLRPIPYGSSNRLEGYLFPDTYEFYLMEEPEDVLARLLRNFRAKVDDDYMHDIRDSGYSVRQIITMASIVEAEAANDEERAKIASVMYNRLNNWDNPLLGMDSTVYYAAMQEGKSFSTKLDNPYNTYKYPGLPPGPICNPGMNSIRAVLNPAQTDYYYFATGVDGLNHFFETEEAFNEFIQSDQYEDIIPGQRRN